MTNLLLSKLETYLLDEEHELEWNENLEQNQQLELSHYEEYPKGFFTSL